MDTSDLQTYKRTQNGLTDNSYSSISNEKQRNRQQLSRRSTPEAYKQQRTRVNSGMRQRKLSQSKNAQMKPRNLENSNRVVRNNRGIRLSGTDLIY